MPYTREEASHTAFVRRIANKAKVKYLGKIQKILIDFYNKKRKSESLGKPATINEPPTDLSGKYILFQDLDTLKYLRSIDFDGGVCNMVVSAPHTRRLADPIHVRNVINTRFQQADQIVTREDMEEILRQKEEGLLGDNTDSNENANKNTGY